MSEYKILKRPERLQSQTTDGRLFISKHIFLLRTDEFEFKGLLISLYYLLQVFFSRHVECKK